MTRGESSVAIANKIRSRELGFDSLQGQEMFLYSTASRLAVGCKQSPIHWMLRALFPAVIWPEREVHHSNSSSAKMKNCGATPPVPIQIHAVVFP